MTRPCIRLLAAAAALLVLCACSTVQDVLGIDSGHVQLSCAGSAPLPAAAPLQASLSPLSPGTPLEIMRAQPQGSVVFKLPEAASGDDFAYSWKEAAVGAGRPPGVWLCRAEWQYDGQFWRLLNFDSKWVGGAS